MDQQTNDLIKNEIDNNEVCLFMKGTPDAPQCGFSMAVSNILKMLEVNFKGVNVLENQNLREGIKIYSDWPTIPQLYVKKEGNLVLILGKTEGHLDQSIFAKEILTEKKGPPPSINLFNEKNIGETVLELIDQNLIDSCHDVSLGGILIAISKMCIKGKKGIKINPLKGLVNKFQYFFGEDQGRYVIELSKKNLGKAKQTLEKNSVHYDEIGTIDKSSIIFDNKIDLSIDELETENKNWLRKYMVN